MPPLTLASDIRPEGSTPGRAGSPSSRAGEVGTAMMTICHRRNRVPSTRPFPTTGSIPFPLYGSGRRLSQQCHSRFRQIPTPRENLGHLPTSNNICPPDERSGVYHPVRLGGVTVDTLDVCYDHPHVWQDDECQALARYRDVVESTLATAVAPTTQASWPCSCSMRWIIE